MNELNWYLRLLVFVPIAIVFQGELPTRGQEPRTREKRTCSRVSAVLKTAACAVECIAYKRFRERMRRCFLDNRFTQANDFAESTFVQLTSARFPTTSW